MPADVHLAVLLVLASWFSWRWRGGPGAQFVGGVAKVAASAGSSAGGVRAAGRCGGSGLGGVAVGGDDAVDAVVSAYVEFHADGGLPLGVCGFVHERQADER